MSVSDDKVITVCSRCLRAACFIGVFYCDVARSASLVEKTVAELRSLGLEHEDYWGEEYDEAVGDA